MTETAPETATLFDGRACALGEGPLWHPERGQIFWFDIPGCRLLSRSEQGPQQWDLPEMCSAAGWIDHDRLLVASEKRLLRLDIGTGDIETVCPLEAGISGNRSNDGRADPQGGFWIGTMSKTKENGAGGIWRYHRGELRHLFGDITVSNAICFTPDGRRARFADSAQRMVWQVALDNEGWPCGSPEVFLDLTAEDLIPDGAVIDRDGLMWIAHWGAARVCAYDPAGRRARVLHVPALHSSCPAFGGASLDHLFITSAREDMSGDHLTQYPQSGMTFIAPVQSRGQPEHRVVIG